MTEQEEISRLREELRNTRLLLGYAIVEAGHDNELFIRQSLIMEYDSFTLEREELPRGGMLLRAIPT